MLSSRSLTARLATALVALALLAGMSGPANAATSPTSPAYVEPVEPSSASLTTTTTAAPPEGMVSTAGVATIVRASACVGNTMNVHKSRGFASVHARTSCPNPGNNKNVSVNLGYVGWFGERYALSHGGKNGNGKVVEAFAKSVCSGKGWQTWRAKSTHRVTIGSTVYLARTGDDSRFGC